MLVLPTPMALVSLNANDIDIAGVAVDTELPVAWVDEELADAHTTARAPGRLTARLSRSGSDIVVRGRVVVSVSTPCARCLDPAPVDVDSELALLLKPVPVPHGKRLGGQGGRRQAVRAQDGRRRRRKPRRRRAARAGPVVAVAGTRKSTSSAHGGRYRHVRRRQGGLDPFIREPSS